MKPIAKIVFLLALSLALSMPTFAFDRWVDGIYGADSNPGTQALPLRSIQRALIVRMPGDKIIVRAGTYALPTGSGVIEQVEVIPYNNEAITFLSPEGNVFQLNSKLTIWSDAAQVGTQPPPADLIIKLFGGFPKGKTPNVKITRRKTNISADVLITVNKDTQVQQ